jgi:2-keto-4-pentenoate hydratase
VTAPDSVAQNLLREHGEGTRFQSFAAANGIGDMAAAYRVQSAFVDLLSRASAARPAGYKVGLTSPRMQAMCGVDQPIAGVVLANRIHRSGATIAPSDYGRLGTEFEIAVRLGRDVPPRSSPYTLETIAEAVDGVSAAVELVDDRHADYKAFDVLSVVADNSWNAGIVHGDFIASWPELRDVEGIAYRNGVELDRGFGRDVLGHPFASLAWLANHLAANGGRLRKGDVVMTGSLVPTRFPAAGEAYRFAVSGIGDVALKIGG